VEGRWGVGVREDGQHKKCDKTSHFSCRGVQVEGRQLRGYTVHGSVRTDADRGPDRTEPTGPGFGPM